MLSSFKSMLSILACLLVFADGTRIPEPTVTNATKCTETKNEVCIAKRDGICEVSAAYPATCVNSGVSTCELAIDWTVADDVVEFSLKKLNYRHSEWTGMIFSKDQSVKSDIVIGVMPTDGSNAKIING